MITQKKKLAATIGITIILLAAIAAAIFFFFKYRQAQDALLGGTDPKVEAKMLVDKISRHIVLPTGEDPTVATINNIDELKNQQFFANAKNGDKVLIYEKAQKAYLYDAKADKLIEVGPVVLPSPTPVTLENEGGVQGDQSDNTNNPTPTTVQALSIVLYNGTTNANVLQAFESKLQPVSSQATVTTRRGARKSDYAKTIVYALSTALRPTAGDIAGKLGATYVKDMPPDEDRPTSGDILIIVGSDQLPEGDQPTGPSSP